MAQQTITYVPEHEARRGASVWQLLFTALVALAAHHLWSPHGDVLDAPQGTEITLTRTFNGWMVTSKDGTTAYNATKIRINAQDHD